MIAINIFPAKMIEDKLKRSNPKYIGFLLNLYKPLDLNVVFSEGNPSLVERPKLIRLVIAMINPFPANMYDNIIRNSTECLLILYILNIDNKKRIQVI